MLFIIFLKMIRLQKIQIKNLFHSKTCFSLKLKKKLRTYVEV